MVSCRHGAVNEIRIGRGSKGALTSCRIKAYNRLKPVRPECGNGLDIQKTDQVGTDAMTIALLQPKPRESLCSKCTGLCCRYVSLPIETPKTRGDFDDVRWYLAHEGFSVFVDEGDWCDNRERIKPNGTSIDRANKECICNLTGNRFADKVGVVVSK